MTIQNLNKTYLLKNTYSYRYKDPYQRKTRNNMVDGSLSLQFKAFTQKDIIHAVRLVRIHILHNDFHTQFKKFKKFKSSRILLDFQYELRDIYKASQDLKYFQKVFTVQRSPFVFKKTREQFGLKKYSKVITLKLKDQHLRFLCYSLSTLTLPCELKCVFNI